MTVVKTVERACARNVGGVVEGCGCAAKGALLEFVHGVCGRMRRKHLCALTLVVWSLRAAWLIKASEATLRPVSYPAYLAGGWLRCRSARASLAACLQHLVAMASKSAAEGEPCTRSAGAMGMLRVGPVADREKGLRSAARGADCASSHGSARKQGADRKSLVKYVD